MALRQAGWILETMDERYGKASSQDIQDTQWIEEASLAGDVLLCKDLAIAHNPLEAPSRSASWSSSSASSSSRPARNGTCGGSRSTGPPAGGPSGRLPSAARTPVLNPLTSPCGSLNSAARTSRATSARNADTSASRSGSARSERPTSGMLVRTSVIRGMLHSPARRTHPHQASEYADAYLPAAPSRSAIYARIVRKKDNPPTCARTAGRRTLSRASHAVSCMEVRQAARIFVHRHAWVNVLYCRRPGEAVTRWFPQNEPHMRSGAGVPGPRV